MGWKDSNLQPIPPKDTALPIELHPSEERIHPFPPLSETETHSGAIFQAIMGNSFEAAATWKRTLQNASPVQK